MITFRSSDHPMTTSSRLDHPMTVSSSSLTKINDVSQKCSLSEGYSPNSCFTLVHFLQDMREVPAVIFRGPKTKFFWFICVHNMESNTSHTEERNGFQKLLVKPIQFYAGPVGRFLFQKSKKFCCQINKPAFSFWYHIQA